MTDTQHMRDSVGGLKLSEVALRTDAPPFSHVFRAGEITVVLGGNGSGKTDLCRFIAGLPSTVVSGEIAFNGVSWASLPTRHRSVGYVFQAFVNYPNLTVAQNIASPLHAQGVPDVAEIQAQVLEIATSMRIESLLTRYPHELSGGQQQRLAIARALARKADVLLLDEPLVNLDFKLREALELELREILRATQTVVIYTSSDQRDAYTLADEVLLLDDGEKLQSGPPLALYREPQSLAAMRIMADPQINIWSDGDQICAVRPEHLELLPPTQRADFEFEVVVEGVETDGSHTLLFGRHDDETWALTTLGMIQVEVGRTLRVGVEAGDVVRFDG